MSQFDFKQAPKQFCDNVAVGFNKEAFLAALFSGNNVGVYALHPGHAKRLAQSLAYNVAEYEKSFGPIDAEWRPGVPSPFNGSGPAESGGHSDPSSKN